MTEKYHYGKGVEEKYNFMLIYIPLPCSRFEELLASRQLNSQSKTGASSTATSKLRFLRQCWWYRRDP